MGDWSRIGGLDTRAAVFHTLAVLLSLSLTPCYQLIHVRRPLLEGAIVTKGAIVRHDVDVAHFNRAE